MRHFFSFKNTILKDFLATTSHEIQTALHGDDVGRRQRLKDVLVKAHATKKSLMARQDKAGMILCGLGALLTVGLVIASPLVIFPLVGTVLGSALVMAPVMAGVVCLDKGGRDTMHVQDAFDTLKKQAGRIDKSLLSVKTHFELFEPAMPASVAPSFNAKAPRSSLRTVLANVFRMKPQTLQP